MVGIVAKNKRSTGSKNSGKIQSPLNKDPFAEVKVVAFSFSAKNREDAAFKQYSLLLRPEILQAHLDFDSKKGKIICIGAFDAQKDLADFGLKSKLLMVEWISYKDYQKRNAACVEY